MQDIFVDNLARLMAQKNISATELAERAPVSRAYVYKLLNKERNATIEMIEGIANYFGLDAYQMIMPNEDVCSGSAKLTRIYNNLAPDDRSALMNIAESVAGRSGIFDTQD